MESDLMNPFLFLLAFASVSSATLSQGGLASKPLAAGSETVADSSSRLAEQFNAHAQMWMCAYNTGDSTTLAALYAPDADYISGHVRGLVTHGRDRVIANFQNGIRAGGHIDSISILSIQLSCDLATLLCRYEASNSGQKAVGRTLLVVKKSNNKWLITLHMTVV
jgi:ketosteroid isomerase-like protein